MGYKSNRAWLYGVSCLSSILRIIVGKFVNTLITLAIATAIITAVFSYQSLQTLQLNAEEELQAWILQMSRQGRPPTEEQIELMRESLYKQYGLDRSFMEWTFIYLRKLLFLDLGNTRTPFIGDSTLVKDQLLLAMKNTIILFMTALLIQTFIGLLIGLYIATRPGGLLDKSISLYGMVSYSLPSWWLGILAIYYFSFKLGWFPSSLKDVYFQVSQIQATGFEAIVEKLKLWAYYLTLPVSVIVLSSIGAWAYLVRNIVIGVMQEDFVTVTRAKGIPERRTLYGHVLRTSSPPIVTYIALSMVFTLGGAIITEAVFNWPGMGLIYWAALLQGEAPLLIGATYILTVLFLLVYFITDLLYALLDPRVRLGGATR